MDVTGPVAGVGEPEVVSFRIFMEARMGKIGVGLHKNGLDLGISVVSFS